MPLFLCFRQRSPNSEFKSFEMWAITSRKVFSNLFRGHSLFGGIPSEGNRCSWSLKKIVKYRRYYTGEWFEKENILNTVITCILSSRKTTKYSAYESVIHQVPRIMFHGHLALWRGWGGLKMDCYSFCFRSTLQYRLSTGSIFKMYFIFSGSMV